MTQATEWRAVPGYEGWYEASTEGQIRRLRSVYNGRGIVPRDDVRILAPLWYRKGYYKVQLGSCGGTRSPTRQYIHRVIFRTFHGEIPEGMTVNHKDGSHDNNRPDNLELATHAEQHHHARGLGIIRHHSNGGPKKAVLTLADVLAIREAVASAPTPPPTRRGTPRQRTSLIPSLARQYGVDDVTIRGIVSRHTWKHV